MTTLPPRVLLGAAAAPLVDGEGWGSVLGTRAGREITVDLDVLRRQGLALEWPRFHSSEVSPRLVRNECS
jgi:hypothetical protein